MITGEQIKAARQRAGLSQGELGQRLGVSLRTVGNWERGETSPRNYEAAIRNALRDHLDDAGTPPLRVVSDAELLAEIARRFARGQSEKVGGPDDQAPNRQAGGSPAADDLTTSGAQDMPEPDPAASQPPAHSPQQSGQDE